MSDEEQESRNVKVFYQNSPLHRAVFAGGAWAGITPNGLLQVALFNDLRPMPEIVVLDVVGGQMETK
jgi:hypothetical protein